MPLRARRAPDGHTGLAKTSSTSIRVYVIKCQMGHFQKETSYFGSNEPPIVDPMVGLKGFWLLLLVPILFTGCSYARGLHRSNTRIREPVLRKTPVGTSRNDVEIFVSHHRWEQIPDTSIKRHNRITVCFGHYTYFLGTAYIYCAWDFNDSNAVADVEVSRERDGL